MPIITGRVLKTAFRSCIDKIGEGFKITHIDLDTKADIPGIDEKRFHEQTEAAKRGCPVSQALAAQKITFNARL
jgi:osmotically inducible protein OsmC